MFISVTKLDDTTNPLLYSGVRHQPLVVLTAEDHQVGWVCAVVAYVAQRDASQGEAGAGLLVAGTLVPIVAYVDERKLFETNVWSVELLLFLLRSLFVVFSCEG